MLWYIAYLLVLIVVLVFALVVAAALSVYSDLALDGSLSHLHIEYI